MQRAIFILILFSSIAYSDEEKMRVTFSASINGGGSVYEINKSLVSYLPEWNHYSEDPPLSVKKAISIAREEMSNQKQEQKMKLSGIRLSSSTAMDKSIVWFYTVTFINDSKNRSDGFISKSFHILMNSDVLKARNITKEEYERWFN